MGHCECMFKLLTVVVMDVYSAGHPQMDLICLSEEPVPTAGVSLNYFPLVSETSLQSITPAQVNSLRLDVFTCGQVNTANICVSITKKLAKDLS